ncbi:MAG: hypothetical protein RH946_16155 [Rhodospirillales bacterium]
MADITVAPKEEWTKFEFEKGIQYIQHLFEQLLVMTRYALLFNVSLAAAAGFLIQITKGNIVQQTPIAAVAIFISLISVVFNAGAWKAHNSSWDMIEAVKDYLQKLEEKMPDNSDDRLITTLGKVFSSKQKITTRLLTQFFYGFLVCGWGILFSILCAALFGNAWAASLFKTLN